MKGALQWPMAVEKAAQAFGQTSRRGFLMGSGAVVISLTLPAMPRSALGAEPAAAGPWPDPDFLQLDTWIVIHPDNTATFFVGKTDGGQGTGTAFRQMMCDELDIAYDRTNLVMGSTDITPDQGGSGGSDGVERDGWAMRRVAAEARRVLLELGSQQLGAPVEMLAGRERDHRAEIRSPRNRSPMPASSAASASMRPSPAAMWTPSPSRQR